MDPALSELLRSQAARGEREVEAIIRLDRPGVDVAGVRMVARFGPVATCRVRTDAVVRARRDEHVVSLKAPRVVGPERLYDAEPGGGLPALPVDGDERRPTGLP